MANDRRFRHRESGLVYFIEHERLGAIDLVTVLAPHSRFVTSDEEIGRIFERCDVRDRLAPTCHRCGGEKFSIPGQFANIGWICGHCNKPKTVVAPSVETHGKADVLISFNDGIARTVTVYSVREGWHACPPCGTLTPVYATPRDAALAHARGLTEAIPTDAKEVQHVRGE